MAHSVTGGTVEGWPMITLLARPETSPSLEENLGDSSPCPYNPPALPLRSSSYVFRRQLLHGSSGPLPEGKLGRESLIG